jgi:hypothetical protein
MAPVKIENLFLSKQEYSLKSNELYGEFGMWDRSVFKIIK